MNCPDCGLENPPVRDACAFCALPLAPGGRREEWERLGPALREEFSRNFERALEARRTWKAKLRRNRARHAAAGAALSGLLGLLTHGPILEVGDAGMLVLLLADAAAGAGVGFLLNHVRGGEYRGMLGFGAVYVASTFLKTALRCLSLGIVYGLLVLPGFLVALGLGYAFGLSLSMRRSLED